MIRAEHLAKRFRAGHLALDDLTLEVVPGEIYCLLGRSGAGKSTAIRLFLNELKPTRGAAAIAGFDSVRQPQAVRQHATIVTEERPAYSGLTSHDNVVFFAKLAGIMSTQLSDAVDKALRRAGLRESQIHEPLRTDDMATRIMIWLAIAELRDCSAVIFDEPIASVPLDTSLEVRHSLREFQRRGKAILVTSSDMQFAVDVADRIGILEDGRLLREYTAAELRRQTVLQMSLIMPAR